MHAPKSRQPASRRTPGWQSGRMLILASASPARRRLLTQAGVAFVVEVSGVDEEALVDVMVVPTPARIAVDLAQAKAGEVAARIAASGAQAWLVLGCDSVFDVDGVAMGKPGTAEEARRRWEQMRGRRGVLHTGHCLIEVSTGRQACELVSTTVMMGDADDEEIDDYIASGEPLAVAGGFTLDGRGAPFIAGIEGDPGNVMGVSLPALRRLARELGVTWPEMLSVPD